MQRLGGLLLVAAAAITQIGGFLLFALGFWWTWSHWGVGGVLAWFLFGIAVVSAITALCTAPLVAVGMRLVRDREAE